MTTPTMALAVAAVLLLLVMVVLHRRRVGAERDAALELEDAPPRALPPIAGGMPRIEGDELGEQPVHMGPPAPEEMDWPPYAVDDHLVYAAAAHEPAVAAARAATAEPAAAGARAQQSVWPDDAVVEEPGWPLPGEMGLDWEPAMARVGASGGAMGVMGAVPADTSRPTAGASRRGSSNGFLGDRHEGFDPAAGWSQSHDLGGDSGITGELRPIDDAPGRVSGRGDLEWSEPGEITTPDAPPLEWTLPEERVDEAEWGDGVDAGSPVPDFPPAEAVAMEDVVADPELFLADAGTIRTELEPEPVGNARAMADGDEPSIEAWLGLDLEASLPTWVPEAAADNEPDAGPDDGHAPALAWWDDPLEPEAEPEPEPELEAVAEPVAGRFALGGFALRPGHEALTGVTFRAPLADPPHDWLVGPAEDVAPGTLVLELDGAVNCGRDDLDVLTDDGFAPTPEGFTLRVLARASGPFAASGTFWVR